MKDKEHDRGAVLQPKSVTVVSSLIAGGVAGTVAKTVVAPIDRAKILFFISSQRFTYKGMIGIFNETIKKEGAVYLWKGHKATLARIVPYAAIQYMAHEQYKRILLRDGELHLPPIRRFIAGSLAGATSTIATYPLDMLRARLATQPLATREYTGIFHAMSVIWKKEGWQGLFRGLSPTLIGIIPYAGTSFFSYETLKWAILDNTSQSNLTVVQRLGCGAAAGIAGQCVTYPLDIIRRRMQTDGPKTTLATLIEIATHQGIVRGLYKGMSVNLFKAPIATGLSYTVFDIVRSYMEDTLGIQVAGGGGGGH